MSQRKWPRDYRVKREGAEWPWCQFRVDVRCWREWVPVRWFLREASARKFVHALPAARPPR